MTRWRHAAASRSVSVIVQSSQHRSATCAQLISYAAAKRVDAEAQDADLRDVHAHGQASPPRHRSPSLVRPCPRRRLVDRPRLRSHPGQPSPVHRSRPRDAPAVAGDCGRGRQPLPRARHLDSARPRGRGLVEQHLSARRRGTEFPDVTYEVAMEESTRGPVIAVDVRGTSEEQTLAALPSLVQQPSRPSTASRTRSMPPPPRASGRCSSPRTGPPSRSGAAPYASRSLAWPWPDRVRALRQRHRRTEPSAAGEEGRPPATQAAPPPSPPPAPSTESTPSVPSTRPPVPRAPGQPGTARSPRARLAPGGRARACALPRGE